MKGIIFYSNGITEPIKSMVEKSIEVGLPITKSIADGECYYDMVCQISDCLSRSKEKYVFFCEHDVVYNDTHFEFTPTEDDVFYYNTNVWRWDYPRDRFISYDGLLSLSSMCANREFALKHYNNRINAIEKMGEERYDRDPKWARKWGYEPGIKNRGFSRDKCGFWESSKPIIDIRHNKTFTPRKVNLGSFKHQPKNWKETSGLIDSNT